MKEKTLIILEETFKHGHGVIPFIILRNPKIPKHLKTVYALFLSYAWYNAECFPGQRRLAQDLGCTEESLRNDLKSLKRLGLMDWKQRGFGKTNIYYLKELPENLKFHPKDTLFHKPKNTLVQKTKSTLDKIDKEGIDEEKDKYNIRKAKSFSRKDYDFVLKAYQKYKGIKLNGPEFLIPQRAIKTMFKADRKPEEIVSFMKWLSENQKIIPWTRTWTIWTVQKKLVEFLAGKLEVSDGDNSTPL